MQSLQLFAFPMDFPLARQRLYRLLHQSEPFSLAEAALYIAQETYPDLQVEVYLSTLDEMAATICSHLPQERYPLKVIQTINQHLFETLGFRGNEQDYYDPRNSFLNDVLERRTGIPITLSLVYLEVAQRIDFPMVGINFPGHFFDSTPAGSHGDLCRSVPSRRNLISPRLSSKARGTLPAESRAA
jgi:regulator of sirC expression with transglutaminase-like and TPR domain